MFFEPFRNLICGQKYMAKQNADNNKVTVNKDKEDDLNESIAKAVDSLSQEQLTGQLLMVGFNGKVPDNNVEQMINLRYAGGIILYGRNIETKGQLTELISELQKMSLTKLNLPLFIAVDQEGGPVSRLKGLITEFPAPSNLGKLSGDEVALVAQTTAKELKSIGINVNLAPVLDVADNKSIMAGRAYGGDPSVVAEKGVAAVNGYQQGGIIACGKHFPGLGSAVQDTHTVSIKISSNLDSLNKRDLIPFRQAIQNGIKMILVSHAVYPALDSQNPASLSYIIQTGILRNMLDYQGLILSDDLEMAAAESAGTVGQNAVRAIKAGADIVLVCHTPEKQKKAYEALLSAVKSGEISQERLKETVKRIVTLKLIEQ